MAFETRSRNTAKDKRVPLKAAWWLLGLLGCSLAHAQVQGQGQASDQAPISPEAGAPARALQIEPRITVSQTFSDNYQLGGARSSGSITDVSPGLAVVSRHGRLQGSLDYSLHGLVYGSRSGNNRVQHQLNAFGQAEVVEDWFFVDASASVSQQAVSAFGTLSADDRLINGNQAQVANVRISPSLRGSFAGEVEYQARLSHAISRADRGQSFDSDATEASLRLKGGTPLRTLFWSTDLTHQVYDFRASRRTEADRIRGVASYALTPQLVVSLIGGRESNNFATLEKQNRNNAGWGVEWRPTERTRLAAEQERRFFGNGHSISFEHRFPRSALRFSDRRDITSPFEQQGRARIGTTFDLFFAQFASLEPDPVLREILVNKFLQANGIRPDLPIVGGFLSSTVTLQRNQTLSFSLQGLRDTVTFAFDQSWSQRADKVSTSLDDFNNTNSIHLRGFSVNVSHRLTPDSALNLLASYSRSQGDLASQTTSLRSLQLTWSSRLGEGTTASLGLRRSEFDSGSQPYTENALTGTITVRF